MIDWGADLVWITWTWLRSTPPSWWGSPTPWGPYLASSAPPSPGQSFTTGWVIDEITNSSVADPGYLSWIPDPDFYSSRISDPGSKNSNKREGWKKFEKIFCSHKISQKWKLFYFWNAKENNLGKFSKNYRTFYQKLSITLSIWVLDPGSGIRDPGSGIRKKPIPDSGSRGQKGTGSRIPVRIRNTD